MSVLWTADQQLKVDHIPSYVGPFIVTTSTLFAQKTLTTTITRANSPTLSMNKLKFTTNPRGGGSTTQATTFLPSTSLWFVCVPFYKYVKCIQIEALEIIVTGNRVLNTI